MTSSRREKMIAAEIAAMQDARRGSATDAQDRDVRQVR